MDKQTKAQWANNLIHDDYFIELMGGLKQDQLNVIMATYHDEINKREDAYRFIKALDLIMAHLDGMAAETVIKSKRWKIL